MKLLLKSLLLFSVVLCDLACAGALLAFEPDAPRVAVLVFAHAIWAGAASVVLLWGAPDSVVKQRLAFIAIAASLSFFIPIIAPIGLLAAMVFGLSMKHVATGEPWLTFPLEEELAAEPVRRKRRTVSPSKLTNILRKRTHETAERRFQAILQVRHLPARTAINVLKIALRDPSDEVRLFAFSRIEKNRDDIETKIKQFSDALKVAEPLERALLHLRLAENHYEIGYLGLAEGAVLEHALAEAHKHAEQACKLRPESAPAEFILGRVLLSKKEYSWALGAFERATYNGYPRAKSLPYMAECAFRQRRYDAVRSILSNLAVVSRESAVLRPVMDFWR